MSLPGSSKYITILPLSYHTLPSCGLYCPRQTAADCGYVRLTLSLQRQALHGHGCSACSLGVTESIYLVAVNSGGIVGTHTAATAAALL